MQLFAESPDKNLLPHNGTVHYFGPILHAQKSDFYFEKMMNSIEWKNDEAIIHGKHIITARKVAWYANEAFPYTYSRITRNALPWTAELLALKSLVEQISGETFNACLLNLYHNGSEGMAWHSDDEKTLKNGGAIASFSLGAERKFAFKHKQTKEIVTLQLAHGSLLLMKGDTQKNWLHRLPPTTKISKPRINLTFRSMKIDDFQ